MPKVTIIIGLPGSGKTSFTEFFPEPRLVYSDWGWEFNITEKGDISSSPHEESRFNDLLNNIETSSNIIIEGSNFCNHKFMCQMEYHLNLNFPNIKIEKYYFENNPKDSIANVFYREYIGGNHWKEVDGKLMFFGHHWWGDDDKKGTRMYEMVIDNINKLTKNYNIPSKYTPLKIQLQDEKFYKGWETLIKK